MATYKTPGVYVEEISKLPPSVAEVSTAIPAFIGCTQNGPAAGAAPVVKRIDTMLDFQTLFGGPFINSFEVALTDDKTAMKSITRTTPTFDPLLYYGVSMYFANGGGSCYIVSIGVYDAKPTAQNFLDGLAALEKEDEPTLILLTDAVCLLPADYYSLAQKALDQCKKLGDRFAILDVLDSKGVDDFRNASISNNLMYGAAYYPYIQTTLTYAYTEDKVTMEGTGTGTKGSVSTDDLAMNDAAFRKKTLYTDVKNALALQRITMPPSSAVAGIYATVDRNRGVWKAPANIGLSSVIGPATKITATDQENLNIDPTAGKSINAIRSFTGKGTLVWGARTLAGNDNEWRYVSVRRLFIMIEESVQKATAFAVFEPNDASTWLKVKAMAESYLYGLWQQGALAGSNSDDAYYVNVGLGKTMTTQDVLEGRLIVEIGVAAVRPAEFIVLRFMHKLQQA